ncbi:MAG: response regulator [Candidatus Omnitrophica bacterium]|jgi:two-component system alkaline phosphatase synthesis response regulator PhoP|nr:response regulator [Candidatus Omnitrophota bacterium]
MPKKVLLVDDEKLFIRMLEPKLKERDFQVVIANSGQEALDKIEQEKPDLVLLDIMMPQMDGIETLRRIRQGDQNLPVFMLTGLTNDENFRSANNLKASGFIVKVNEIDQQLEHISSIVRLSERFSGQVTK